jgi:hypothetical protein
VNIVSAPIISSYLKQFTTSQEMKITDTSPAQGLEEHWREIQRGYTHRSEHRRENIDLINIPTILAPATQWIKPAISK